MLRHSHSLLNFLKGCESVDKRQTVVLPVAQPVPEYSHVPEQRYMRVSSEEAAALQANGFCFEARTSADGQIIKYDAVQESAIKDALTALHEAKHIQLK